MPEPQIDFAQGESVSLPAHPGTDAAMLARILRRPHPMFAADLEAKAQDLRRQIWGARVLVVGAAGSIGSAFVRQILDYRPSALHLIDLAENALAETVRDLRSSPAPAPDEFSTVAVDFGSIGFDRYLSAQRAFDWIINFAAVKHVRSERDAYSLMHMVDVNVGALVRLQKHPGCSPRIFSVSTDKAVRPANFMGATKNLMEQALFGQDARSACSARFANVAFSAGSLLEGFNNRLMRRQPLAAPTGIQRYFISQEEAGQLCLIATFLGRHRSVFVPKLSRDRHLRPLTDVAADFLAHYGLEPVECASESEAKDLVGKVTGCWPCYFSPSDTSGEKDEEEFVRGTDRVDSDSFGAAAFVIEPRPDPAILERFLSEIETIRWGTVWSKPDVTAAIARAVPELHHRETGLNLDQKM